MIGAVISRLQARVPELNNRTYGAADFAELMQRKALPQNTPAAHVLGLGLQGGQVQSAAGAFTQMLDAAIGIILTIRSHSRTGHNVLDDVEGLIDQVIAAIAGWGPNDEIGVFRLARGNLVSMSAGTLVYQLDFTITDQLRIIS